MSSNQKFFPWDAISHFPQEIKTLNEGMYAFLSPDPFLQKVFLNLIDPNRKEELHLSAVHSFEISVEWLESHLMSLDLFQTKSAFFVLESEKLSKACLDYLEKKGEESQNTAIIFLFLKKSDSYKKMLKLDFIQSFEVEPPRFWEGKKLLNFLCDVTGVRLSYEVQTFILDHVENTSANFLNLLKNIALTYPRDGKINVEMVREIIEVDKLDKFLLATHLGNKENKKFFQLILPFKEDFDLLRESFAFLQSHFLKILDPTYMDKKSRLTKYDQQIKQQSGYFSQKEIEEIIDWLTIMEIESKKKSSSVAHELQRKLLCSF